MSSTSRDAEVLIVGAGPGGVSAAVMAASLDLSTTVIEAETVGGKLHSIGVMENVPGWTTGSDLAAALTRDIDRLRQAGRCTVLRARASAVRGYRDRAEISGAAGMIEQDDGDATTTHPLHGSFAAADRRDEHPLNALFLQGLEVALLFSGGIIGVAEHDN